MHRYVINFAFKPGQLAQLDAIPPGMQTVVG